MQPQIQWFFSNYRQGFVLHLAASGASQETISDYSKAFKHFTRWGNDRLDFTTAELKGFFAWLREQPNGRGGTLAPKSIYNYWVGMRSFYKWFAEETGQTSNPMAGVRPPKTSEPVIQPLSQAEVVAVLKACERGRPVERPGQRPFTPRRPTAARDRAVVLTLLDSGLRASELAGLTVGDVDLTSGQVVVRRGKGGRGRIVYIGRASRRAAWRYVNARQAAPSEPLFISVQGRPFNRDTLRQLCANCAPAWGSEPA